MRNSQLRPDTLHLFKHCWFYKVTQSISKTAAHVNLNIILCGLSLILFSKLSICFFLNEYPEIFFFFFRKIIEHIFSHTWLQISAVSPKFSCDSGGGTGPLLMQRSMVKSLWLHVEMSFGGRLTPKLFPVGLFFFFNYRGGWLLLLGKWNLMAPQNKSTFTNLRIWTLGEHVKSVKVLKEKVGGSSGIYQSVAFISH